MLTLSVTLILLIASSIATVVSASTLFFYVKKIAGQGFIEYTGNVEIKSIAFEPSNLKLGVDVAKAGTYSIELTINDVLYTKSQTWSIGSYTVEFAVTYPPAPFKVSISISEE